MNPITVRLNHLSVRRPSPGDATILRDILALRDQRRVRAALGERYGFTPTLAFCADFVALIDALTGPPGGYTDEPGE